MSLQGILLGLINIAIVIAILLLIGAIILWFLSWMGFAPPDNVRKLYLAIVALIFLAMIVALLFGIPTVRVIGKDQGRVIGGWIPPAPDIIAQERQR